jgi:hypothetical protein
MPKSLRQGIQGDMPIQANTVIDPEGRAGPLCIA